MKKKCRICKVEKELSEFPKAHATLDNRDSICRECYRGKYKDKQPTEQYKDNFFTHDKYYS